MRAEKDQALKQVVDTHWLREVGYAIADSQWLRMVGEVEAGWDVYMA